MDKVRIVLAAMKKYHFWLLCLLVLIVGLGVWHKVASDTEAKYIERQKKLTDQRKAVFDLSQQVNPANEVVCKAIDAEHEVLKKEVVNAWDYLFRNQKNTNPWPRELSEDFHRVIGSLALDDDIPRPYREMYQVFIHRHLPALKEMVDAERPKPGALGASKKAPTKKEAKKDIKKGIAVPKRPMGMPGRSGTDDDDIELIGKVRWDKKNVDYVEQRFYWSSTPTTQQVRLAQEDLWVIEALLRIIRDTNQGSTSRLTASIKKIFAIEIGRDAALAFLQSEGMCVRVPSAEDAAAGGAAAAPGGAAPGGAAPGGAAPAPPSAGAGPKTSGPAGGGMGGGGAGAGAGGGGAPMGPRGPTSSGGPMMGPSDGEMMENLNPSERLLEKRYVDQDFKPLGARKPQPFPEFKMMPVRLHVKIDQRRIARFLTLCANSSMPVEVRRVMLRPENGKTIDLTMLTSPGPGGSTSEMPGMGMGMGMPMMGPSASGLKPVGGAMFGDDTEEGAQPGEVNYDMPIEVQGIIYIFNPVPTEKDKEKLGIWKDDSTPEPAAAKTGEKPAAAKGGEEKGGEPAETAPKTTPKAAPKAEGTPEAKAEAEKATPDASDAAIEAGSVPGGKKPAAAPAAAAPAAGKEE